MKTTKRTSLEKRIEKLNLSKNSIVLGLIKDMKKGDLLRPVYSQGSSWKHSSLVDKTLELLSILKVLGIEYTTGNDAPKGGKTGFFVRVETKIIE